MSVVFDLVYEWHLNKIECWLDALACEGYWTDMTLCYDGVPYVTIIRRQKP